MGAKALLAMLLGGGLFSPLIPKDNWPGVIVVQDGASKGIGFGHEIRCVFVPPVTRNGWWVWVDRSTERVRLIRPVPKRDGVWEWWEPRYASMPDVRFERMMDASPESMCGRGR